MTASRPEPIGGSGGQDAPEGARPGSPSATGHPLPSGLFRPTGNGICAGATDAMAPSVGYDRPNVTIASVGTHAGPGQAGGQVGNCRRIRHAGPRLELGSVAPHGCSPALVTAPRDESGAEC